MDFRIGTRAPRRTLFGSIFRRMVAGVGGLPLPCICGFHVDETVDGTKQNRFKCLMDEEYEERVYSFLRGGEGWDLTQDLDKEGLMKKIALNDWNHKEWIVQFWAPGAKQDEHGPLFYYTREEFPARNFAMLCCKRGYMALPILNNEGTGNGELVGVLEFLGFDSSDHRRTTEGPMTDKYVGSFLSLLLPMIKHELKSFKLACGKELGEELVVEVIEFSDANTLDYSESEPAFSVSTIKRANRKRGIQRWPSLSEEASAANSEQDLLPSTSNVHPLENMTQIITGSADKVIVKVKYNEEFIRFELSEPLLLAKLTEEVAMRLNLEMASFKLKYVDEEGDAILLTRDSDLDLCPKTRTATVYCP
ncbi:hypothetical protein SASPL_105194 [Salvia splendens]|uniref:PB1 domain-containing protein n=1 Tax=Salvia splendens TaxID=180675 RepID=A0A8X8YP62_SALSN|nr:hypothetical protein SASPL_105194 [Salvia splendens]